MENLLEIQTGSGKKIVSFDWLPQKLEQSKLETFTFFQLSLLVFLND